MKIIQMVLIGAMAVAVCNAQTINISGKVTDTGTTPIAGAIVKLENGSLTDTTGADGSFTLSGTVGVKKTINQTKRPFLSVKTHNGLLNISVVEKTVVAITTYNLHGQVISTLQKTMDVGSHSIAKPSTSAGVYLYKVKAGNSELVIKNPSIGGISQETAGSVQENISAARAKQVLSTIAINDVLAVTKDGYLNYRVIAENSDTSGIEIKMIRCEEPLIDIDENVYQTVRIGNQVWMAENLRVTKYNDGSEVPLVTDDAAWRTIYDSSLTTPAYCYNKNTTNADTIKKYGALYNWYVVSSANTRKIAPKGWHVPSDSEWTVLENYLVLNGYNWDGTTAGNKIAKSLAAKTDWIFYKTIGTIGRDLTKNNRTGFSALPGGCRDHIDFYTPGYSGEWWSTTECEFHTESAWTRFLNSGSTFTGNNLARSGGVKSSGFSVRLVRD